MIDTDIHRIKRRLSAFLPDDIVIIENQKVLFFSRYSAEKTSQKNQQTRFFKEIDSGNGGKKSHHIRIAKEELTNG
jgi:hypothetical protein